MRVLKKVLLILVICLCTIFMVGCEKTNKNKSEDVIKKDIVDNNIVGKYELYSTTEDGITVNAEDFKKYEISGSLIVNSDKTAILKISDSDAVNVNYDDNYFYSTEDDEEKISYVFENGLLTMKNEEIELVFKKKK